MSRAELVATMRSFGWTKTGELPGVCENWEPPTDVRDTWITVPLREDASDYEHYMRRAWNTLGRHEGPQLLTMARQVAALHQPRTVYANESHCPRRHDAEHDEARHKEDVRGFWVCLDYPMASECQTCTDEDGATSDYPCPTAKLLAPLTQENR